MLLTNAAGGLDPGYRPGDLMVIRDQIDTHFADPLRGLLADPWLGGGEAAAALGRAPAPGPLYHPEKSRLLYDAAAAAGVSAHLGVYASVWGPSYETRAEIGFLRRLPADAVGMSTAPEAVLLRAMGVDVVGLSCITNAAHEFGDALTTHDGGHRDGTTGPRPPHRGAPRLPGAASVSENDFSSGRMSGTFTNLVKF